MFVLNILTNDQTGQRVSLKSGIVVKEKYLEHVVTELFKRYENCSIEVTLLEKILNKKNRSYDELAEINQNQIEELVQFAIEDEEISAKLIEDLEIAFDKALKSQGLNLSLPASIPANIISSILMQLATKIGNSIASGILVDKELDKFLKMED